LGSLVKFLHTPRQRKERIRVVYRFFTPPLAGIGKLLALFGRYFGVGIRILPKSHNWVFCMYDLVGTPFEDFAGTLFFENLAGIPFVPQKEGKLYKRGPKPPHQHPKM
jgi:hypothetical protein